MKNQSESMNGDHEDHDGGMKVGYKERLGSEKKAACYVEKTLLVKTIRQMRTRLEFKLQPATK